MAKVTLTDIANTEASSIIAAFNNNNQLIEEAFDNTLSRDGDSPNTMSANLDMNNYRVINLPEPTLDGEAARKSYVDDLVNTLNEAKLDEAIDAYQETLTLRDETQDLRDEAEVFRDEAASFVGAATSAQTLSNPRTFSYTGDVAGGPTSFDGSANVSTALTIANDSVSNAKLANMAQSRVKGRVSSGSGDPEDLTGSQVTGLLDVFNTSNAKGVVDRGGTSNTTEFLRRDGNWGTPPSSVVPNSGSYVPTEGSVQIGDMILKWGVYTTVGTAEGSYSIPFSSAFPNSCVHAQLTGHSPGAATNEDQWPQLVNRSTTGLTMYLQRASGGSSYTMTVSWMALGY